MSEDAQLALVVEQISFVGLPQVMSRSSVMMSGSPRSSMTAAMSWTMLGCRSCAMMLISRRMRVTDSESLISPWRHLTATS